MVEVPRITQRTVAGQPTPRTGVAPIGDIAAFGGGRAAAAPAEIFRQTTNITQNIAIREALKGDEILDLTARKELAALENDITWGQNGFFKQRGKNAIGAVDRVRDAWGKGISDIESRLTNSRQKEAFRRLVAGRQPTLFRGAMQHVSVQMQKHEDQELGSLMANLDNRTLNNWQDETSARVSNEEKKIELDKWARRSGIGEEELKRVKDTEVSKSHMLQMGGALDAKQDIFAKDYFNEIAKNELTAQDKVTIQRRLQRGSFLGELQRAEDGLLGQGLTLEEAEEKAKQTGPPEFRDELLKRVRTEFRERGRRQEDAYQGFLDQQFKAVMANPTSLDDAIPLTVQDNIRATDLLRLQAVIERVKNPAKPSNTAAFHDFWTMTPEDRARLSRSDMLGLRSHLSELHWTQAVRERDRNRQELASNKINSRSLTHSEIRATIRTVVPSATGARTLTEKTRRRLAEAQVFAEFFAERDDLPEKERTEDAQRKLLRRLLRPHVQATIDGFWWFRNSERTVEQLGGDFEGDWVLSDVDQRRLDSLIEISPTLKDTRPSDAIMNERMNRAWVAMRLGESEKLILEILEGKRWPEE